MMNLSDYRRFWPTVKITLERIPKNPHAQQLHSSESICWHGAKFKIFFSEKEKTINILQYCRETGSKSRSLSRNYGAH